MKEKERTITSLAAVTVGAMVSVIALIVIGVIVVAAVFLVGCHRDAWTGGFGTYTSKVFSYRGHPAAKSPYLEFSTEGKRNIGTSTRLTMRLWLHNPTNVWIAFRPKCTYVFDDGEEVSRTVKVRHVAPRSSRYVLVDKALYGGLGFQRRVTITCKKGQLSIIPGSSFRPQRTSITVMRPVVTVWK